MKTALCDRLGIELPIIQAPMGGAVGPALASAVSSAGGLGMLVPWRADIDTARCSPSMGCAVQWVAAAFLMTTPRPRAL